MRVKWYGHSAFEVQIGDKVFLVDPWLSNPKSPDKGDFPVETDYVIVTHDHGDHLGDTITILKKNKNAKAIAIFEIANYIAAEIGDPSRVIDANIGGPIQLDDGYFVILTSATHSSQRGHSTGALFGREDELVFHAGDTGITYDMKIIGELYNPKVALLPIGGHYTMGPKEAAKAAELIRPKYVIPMHYGTFPVLRGTPEEFKEWVSKFAPDTKVVVLQPGEEVNLE